LRLDESGHAHDDKHQDDDDKHTDDETDNASVHDSLPSDFYCMMRRTRHSKHWRRLSPMLTLALA
jgi:hypothetical protein